MKDKLLVLGLDGFSHYFLCQKYFKENMPFFTRFCKTHNSHSMNSVIPVVSSVAWTSYSTGKNPGEHGIYGFVDRISRPFQLFVPTSNNRSRNTIFTELSKNKKVYSINVPISYPPEPVSGKMVSCFLCPEIQKSTYPLDYWKELYKRDYIIDVDATLISVNPIEMLYQLICAMEIRFELLYSIILDEEWDFIQLHIMETDRLLHFFYNCIEKNDKSNKEEEELTNVFFQKLDLKIQRMLELIGSDCKLLVLSDHGMCKINKEVQINLWLKQKGWLKIDDTNLEKYKKESICYSLTPGRIYINRKGREEKGYIEDEDYEQIRKMIKNELLRIKDDETGEYVINKVYLKEDLYSGDQISKAPDLIAQPNKGFDLKANTVGNSIFSRGYLNGMHTLEDAMIVGKNIDVSKVESIDQIYDVIIRSFR